MNMDDLPLKRSPNWLMVIHILLWAALAVATYATATTNKFASCWHIIILYFPPSGILLLAIAGYSLIVLLLAIVRPATRATLSFSFAIHGMIFTLGWLGSTLIAATVAGEVSCL